MSTFNVQRAIEATMVALLEWKAPHAGSRRFKSFRYRSIGIFAHFGSLMVKATAKLLLLVGISGRHQTLKDLFIQITRSSVECPRMGILVAWPSGKVSRKRKSGVRFLLLSMTVFAVHFVLCNLHIQQMQNRHQRINSSVVAADDRRQTTCIWSWKTYSLEMWRGLSTIGL